MSRKHFSKSLTRQISSLTELEKVQLSRYIFYNLKESIAVAGAGEIDQCFGPRVDQEHQLSFSRLLRGHYWLRTKGFEVPQSTPVLTAVN